MNAVRLAFGTLTVLPMRPPLVDRRTAGWAMVLAPLVGLVTVAPVVLIVQLVEWWLSPLLTAALCLAVLALITRAIHLDGLADTADGLGSGRDADDALLLMRKGDVGPFGVVTLVLLLLIQVSAVAQLLAAGRGGVDLAAAVVVSRLALPLACLHGIPPARSDGLGAVVAGTVSRPAVVLAVLLAAAPLVVLAMLAGPHVLVAFVALGAGALVGWRAVDRLGGITGDVLGAITEVTFATALVALCLV